MNPIDIGHRRYVILTETRKGLVMIWVEDVTGEKFTRFAVTAEPQGVNAEIERLKKVLEEENAKK